MEDPRKEMRLVEISFGVGKQEIQEEGLLIRFISTYDHVYAIIELPNGTIKRYSLSTCKLKFKFPTFIK